MRPSGDDDARDLQEHPEAPAKPMLGKSCGAGVAIQAYHALVCVPLRRAMSAWGHVHVIGAGLAGLSAAVRLAEAGCSLTLHEAAGHAGGRCRSFHDSILDRVIDNGTHLVLSGNHAVMDYLSAIGAEKTLHGPSRAEFPFVDLKDGVRWTVRPDRSAIPWSVFSIERRVPGTGIGDYLSAWRLARATAMETVGECLATEGALWWRFWHPFTIAILNTEPTTASAELLWAVLKESFGRGKAACRPMLAANGLSATFVDPALRYLSGNGCEVNFNQRVHTIVSDGGLVSALNANERIDLGPDDAVILAVPPVPALQLMPELTVPDSFQPIVNGHFRIAGPLPETAFIGIVGGTAEWLFVRGDVVSLTVSAAAGLSEKPENYIADAMWSDLSRVLGLNASSRGPCRIIKEKRATIEQTPAQVARRPKTKTASANLFLAGDWTDTGLPATIEGTLRSGFAAADSVLKLLRNL